MMDLQNDQMLVCAGIVFLAYAFTAKLSFTGKIYLGTRLRRFIAIIGTCLILAGAIGMVLSRPK
jgi:hypothetical protein